MNGLTDIASKSLLAKGVDHCLSCDLRRAVFEKLRRDGRVNRQLLAVTLQVLGAPSLIISVVVAFAHSSQSLVAKGSGVDVLGSIKWFS